MKLFNDKQYKVSYQTCQRIKEYCKKQKLKSNLNINYIATKSIRNLIKN